MKRALLILLVFVAVAAASFHIGRDEGIRHAIEDSEIWTVDVYTPGHPELSEWNGYDQLIFITLDGQDYEHGMYQG